MSSAAAGEEQAAAAGAGSSQGADGAGVRPAGLKDPAGAAEGLHADGVGESGPSFCFCHESEEPGGDEGGGGVDSASSTPAACSSAEQ